MVVLNCVKKYTQKERLEGNAQKCYNGGYLWVVKSQRFFSPLTYDLNKFFSIYCFYNQEKLQKERKVSVTYNQLCQTSSITPNTKLWATWEVGTKIKFCLAYHEIEKEQSVLLLIIAFTYVVIVVFYYHVNGTLHEGQTCHPNCKKVYYMVNI